MRLERPREASAQVDAATQRFSPESRAKRLPSRSGCCARARESLVSPWYIMGAKLFLFIFRVLCRLNVRLQLRFWFLPHNGCCVHARGTAASIVRIMPREIVTLILVGDLLF